jgi:hypothetical protein
VGTDLTRIRHGETWHRVAYRYPDWKFRIGHADGYARGHWLSNRKDAESLRDATVRQGGEAFIETEAFGRQPP